MLVGEQPGDREDIEGHPFVGPAGRVLDSGLQRAGIERPEVFVTNVVKHFRYKTRGKRRIHQRPDRDSRLRLPAVAGRRAVGSSPAKRWCASAPPPPRPCSAPTSGSAAIAAGRWISDLAELVTLTTHPSAILRMRDESARHERDGRVRRRS